MFEELALDRVLSNYLSDSMISDIEFLILLLLMMLVMNSLQLSGLLSSLGQKLAAYTKNERWLALSLCLLVFVTSAFLTNDIVLLGIVPLTIAVGVSSRVDVKRIVIFEGIAANTGGLITPFGNPQNIYISVHYDISLAEFVKAMAALWLVSLALLVALIFLTFTERELHRVHRKKPHHGIAGLGIAALFTIILYFAHALPILLIAPIVLSLLIATGKIKRILKMFDLKLYALFVGIAFGTYVLLKLWSPHITGFPLLLSAIGLSQVISNVPATFVLSGTSDWKLLALGVNIGGSGTLISSIATVIAYRYAKKYDSSTHVLDFMKWGALFCISQLFLMLLIIYFGIM